MEPIQPAQPAKLIMERGWCIVKQFGSKATNRLGDARCTSVSRRPRRLEAQIRDVVSPRCRPVVGPANARSFQQQIRSPGATGLPTPTN